MSEALKMSRKAFTAAVVATTIAWSIGFSALLAPLSASAATAGTLVKASLPAVYYVGSDGKRYVFPNEKTYKTWYADFSTVQTITDAELASMPIGGNVTYKPGIRMVKITTDPKVYAVDAHGALRWVSSEAVAIALYGASWNQMIDDVPDAFFTNYTLGADITAVGQYAPATVTAAAASINVDKGLGSSGSVSGTLTATLNIGNPAATTLPRAATGVVLVKVDVRNSGSSAITVDALTVRRAGPGAAADFAAVYAYQDNARLTTGRTINTTTNEASFSGLNVSLAAGETKSLSVVGDVAAVPGAGNVNSFSIVALSAGTAAAAGLPLAGPNFTMSSATAGTVTITRSGAAPLSNVKLGGMSQKIAEFQVTVGAAEDVRVTKIALYQAGAVSKTSLSNLTLKQGGLTIASVAGYDTKDRATFVLANPMLLEKGTTRTFEVYADIAANARVGAAETILSYVDQPADVLAIGQTYGVGVGVDTGTVGTYDGTGCGLGAGNCSSTRIEGGQLTMTFNGPAVHDVAVNGKDVELYNFTMAAASNLEVRNLRMRINAGVVAGAADGLLNGPGVANGDSVPNYSDIKITDVATGAIIAGPLSLSTLAHVAGAGIDTLQPLTFTEVFNLAAGQARTFKVTADVANNVAVAFANDTVSIDRLAFALGDIRNLDNSTNIVLTDIVPNTLTIGNAMNIKLPTMTAVAGSTPVAQTFIMGSQGVTVLGIGLQAGEAAAIRVNSLTLQGQIDDVVAAGTFVNGAETLPGTAGFNTIAGIVSTAKLMNGSVQIGETKSPATSTLANTGGDITFDNLNLVIAKGQSAALALVVNISGGLAGLGDDIRFQVTAGTSNDADGNNVAVAGLPFNGPIMTLAGAGTLTMALAPSDTESEAGIVVGGSSNVVLAKYKLTAQNEELKLIKLGVLVATPAGANSISLYDGSTLVGGPAGVTGAGVASFTDVNFVIPKDGSKILTVKANLNSVGATGAATGSAVTASILANAVVPFEIRGTSAGSSTLLNAPTVGGLPMAAYAKIMRKTKPTIALVTLPSTTLDAGDKVAMRFSVSADAAGDVSIKTLTFKVSKTTLMTLAGSGASSIRRVGDGANLPGALALDAGCNAAATACTLYASFGAAVEEVIAAGTSRTYDLRLTLGAIPATASISTYLNTDVATETGALAAATAPPPYMIAAGTDPGVFLWSDNSAVGHNATVAGSADWATGQYVKILPTDTQTLSN